MREIDKSCHNRQCYNITSTAHRARQEVRSRSGDDELRTVGGLKTDDGTEDRATAPSSLRGAALGGCLPQLAACLARYAGELHRSRSATCRTMASPRDAARRARPGLGSLGGLRPALAKGGIAIGGTITGRRSSIAGASTRAANITACLNVVPGRRHAEDRLLERPLLPHERLSKFTAKHHRHNIGS